MICCNDASCCGKTAICVFSQRIRRKLNPTRKLPDFRFLLNHSDLIKYLEFAFFFWKQHLLIWPFLHISVPQMKKSFHSSRLNQYRSAYSPSLYVSYLSFMSLSFFELGFKSLTWSSFAHIYKTKAMYLLIQLLCTHRSTITFSSQQRSLNIWTLQSYIWHNLKKLWFEDPVGKT